MSTRARGFIVQPVEVPADLSYGDYYSHAVAFASDDTVHLICSEGVGCAITAEDIDRMKMVGEPMDLADFIRTFGGRLDANHYMWTRRLARKA